MTKTNTWPGYHLSTEYFENRPVSGKSLFGTFYKFSDKNEIRYGFIGGFISGKTLIFQNRLMAQPSTNPLQSRPDIEPNMA